MHLEAEQIQRLIHGELEAPARAALSRHLGECGDCRRRLEEADLDEKRVLDLLREVDQEAPLVTAPMLARRARRERSAWHRKAAGVVLALMATGAVAYAVPDSPIRGWLERATAWVGMTVPSNSPRSGEAPFREANGIAVAPGERFAVRFTAEQSKGVVIVSMTDENEVVARVLDGTATFTTALQGLLIDNRGSAADYAIDLPKSAPQVEILIAGRRAWLKQKDRVLTEAPIGPSGGYVIPLAPKPP
jgi:hypothetical protein